MSSACQTVGVGVAPPKAPLQLNHAEHADPAPQTQSLNNGQSNHAEAATATATAPVSLVQDKVAKLKDGPEKKEPETRPHSNGTAETNNGGVHPEAAAAEPAESAEPCPAAAPASKATTAAAVAPVPEFPEVGGCDPATGDGGAEPAATAGQAEDADKHASANSSEKTAAHPKSLDSKIDQLKQLAADSSRNSSPVESASLATDGPAPLDRPSDPVATETKPATAPTDVEPAVDPAVPAEKEDKPSVESADAAKKTESATADSGEAAVEENAEPADEKKKSETKPKSTLKLATVTPNRKRKKEPASPRKADADSPSPAKRTREKPAKVERVSSSGDQNSTENGTPDGRTSKRNRTKVQPYQSPTPDLAIATKLSTTRERVAPVKQNDEKLIVFYKNEFLAVRNSEGGFYVCQAMQNVYRSTKKIKIRWLSQDKAGDPEGDVYKPDFYDITDIECVLTTLVLQRTSGGMRLGAAELARTKSILGRALAVERGEPPPDNDVTEEHPDGLDLSLYKNEAQLEKIKQKTPGGSRKRSHSKTSMSDALEESDTEEDSESDSSPAPKRRSGPPPKKAKAKTPKSKSPKGKSKTKNTPKDKQPPISAPTTNKTATTPAKSSVAPKKKSLGKTPKSAAPIASKTPKSATKAPISAAIKTTPQPSTSSTTPGKPTRSPRKPPVKK